MTNLSGFLSNHINEGIFNGDCRVYRGLSGDQQKELEEGSRKPTIEHLSAL